jgi:hypothetical protein
MCFKRRLHGAAVQSRSQISRCAHGAFLTAMTNGSPGNSRAGGQRRRIDSSSSESWPWVGHIAVRRRRTVRFLPRIRCLRAQDRSAQQPCRHQVGVGWHVTSSWWPQLARAGCPSTGDARNDVRRGPPSCTSTRPASMPAVPSQHRSAACRQLVIEVRRLLGALEEHNLRSIVIKRELSHPVEIGAAQRLQRVGQLDQCCPPVENQKACP